MKAFLIFQLAKGAAAFGACWLLFSIVPATTWVLLLPVDAIVWRKLSGKWTAGRLAALSTAVWIFAIVAAIGLAIAGYRDSVRFLFDLDALR